MDLVLNNLQRVMCHKTQPTKHLMIDTILIFNLYCFIIKIFFFYNVYIYEIRKIIFVSTSSDLMLFFSMLMLLLLIIVK